MPRDRVGKPAVGHRWAWHPSHESEFHLSPAPYKGEWRCDTHPRFSPDGRKVVIDSPHGGNGRQMYLIDIGEIVA